MKKYEAFRRLQITHLHRDLSQEVGHEAVAQGLTEDALLEELRDTRQQVVNEKYGEAMSQ